MSGGGEHLKDEVDLLSLSNASKRAKSLCQGSKSQVLIAGATAGLVSRFCIAPLDVIKIRLQLQTYPLRSGIISPVRNRDGATSIIRSIFRNEGIQGFWRGNIPAELLYISYGSIQFSTYRLTTNLLSTTPTPIPDSVMAFVAGAFAGAVATSATYPLDLLRTRFAAQGTLKIYASLLSSVRIIYLTEGLPGFFRGLGAGVAQIVPYMGLFFSTYEKLRPLLGELELPFGSGEATAGVLASVVAKTGVFPLDLIRKRIQVQGPTRERFAGGMIPLYGKGMLRVGKEIVAKEGWRGLYGGLGVGLIKAAPASAVTMWTYEQALKELKEWGVGNEDT
ncbi:mitochondrial thiamine pyrophosphate transporter [Xylographa bjoerkii]|nr:mitochondrial thiamine pyrophosphate transporter [Xylographa bjoerkii]